VRRGRSDANQQPLGFVLRGFSRSVAPDRARTGRMIAELSKDMKPIHRDPLMQARVVKMTFFVLNASVFGLTLFLAFAPRASATTDAQTVCQQILEGYKARPTFQIAPEERLVSKELQSFFDSNPHAKWQFTMSFYNDSDAPINSTLLKALQLIPQEQRARVVQASLENTKKEGQSFQKNLYSYALKQPGGEALLHQAHYKFRELMLILAAAKDAGFIVAAYFGGRGQVASVTDSKRQIVYYKFVDDDSRVGGVAQPFSAAQFEATLAWRVRPKLDPNVASHDAIHRLEQVLDPNMRASFRYLINAGSLATYNRVNKLIESARVMHIVMDPSVVPVSYSDGNPVSLFLSQVWEYAVEDGLRLDEPDYLLSEFRAMRGSLRAGVQDWGMHDLLLVPPDTQERLFFRQQKHDGLDFMVRITELQALEAREELRRRREERVSRPLPHFQAISLDAKSDQFPDHVREIPAETLAALNVGLNPQYFAESGFKQPGEDLLEIIRQDLEMIHKRGYTAKQLADWLAQIIRAKREKRQSITIHGHEYIIRSWGYGGMQNSPFRDPVSWADDYLVINMQTGKQIYFSGGHPYMIGYYGFFEGNVSMRVDPTELMDMIESK
jgi:hypothetical protein